MEELERLRSLVGPEAAKWTTAELEQLQHDINAVAVLLLDLYRSRLNKSRASNCGSPDFDVPSTDR
jgi:hypothetical protein